MAEVMGAGRGVQDDGRSCVLLSWQGCHEVLESRSNVPPVGAADVERELGLHVVDVSEPSPFSYYGCFQEGWAGIFGIAE